MNFKPINQNDSGLLSRTKINESFYSVIKGTEGIDSLWKALLAIKELTNSNSETIDEVKEEVIKGIFSTMDYTDREIHNILSYINGMSGGVNGFAEDENFKPDYPLEVSATVIGIGPGVFKYMLDSEGNPIEIKDVCTVIFYKGAGISYWKYKTVTPTFIEDRVFDGGRADSNFGGARVIDCGGAEG